MEQKTLLIRFTGEKELELYEWLRREKFETGLAMAEIIRQALELCALLHHRRRSVVGNAGLHENGEQMLEPTSN